MFISISFACHILDHMEGTNLPVTMASQLAEVPVVGGLPTRLWTVFYRFGHGYGRNHLASLSYLSRCWKPCRRQAAFQLRIFCLVVWSFFRSSTVRQQANSTAAHDGHSLLTSSNSRVRVPRPPEPGSKIFSEIG